MGPITGGTVVTIIGTNFRAGATVQFGAVAATSVIVNSDTQITATVPAAAAVGWVSVTVTNVGGGYGVTKLNMFYYDYPAPTISGVSPASGPTTGGTVVTITGTGFRSGATVNFYYGSSIYSTSVTVNSSTQITAVAPTSPAGAVSAMVLVTNSDGKTASKANAFTYTAPSVVALTSVPWPHAFSMEGESLTLTGSGFAAGATVRLTSPYGDAYATVLNVTSTRIDFIGNSVWGSAPYTGQGITFTVTNPDGGTATMTGGYDASMDWM